MSELRLSFEYLIDGEWRFQTSVYTVFEKGRICGRNSLYYFSGIKHGLNYLNLILLYFFQHHGQEEWQKEMEKGLR